MRALLFLPLLGGCWLGNDFSRFEHGDGGHVPDLAHVTPGFDMAGPCMGELSWNDLSHTPMFPNVTGATLVSLPSASGARLFLIGGCMSVEQDGTTCDKLNDQIFELTIDNSGVPALTSFGAASVEKEVQAAAAPYPVDDAQPAQGATALVVVGSTADPTELDVSFMPPAVALADRAPFNDGNAPTRVAAALADNNLWVVGGRVNGKPSGDTYVLSNAQSPTMSSWTLEQPLTTFRSDSALAVFADAAGAELWAIGGTGVGQIPLASIETHVMPLASPWTLDLSVSLAQARYDHAAVTAADGRIYVIGGTGGTGGTTPLDSVEVTCGRSFHTMTTPLPSTLSPVSAAVGPDNRIYAIGTTPQSSAGPGGVAFYAYGPTVSTSYSMDRHGIDITGAGFPANAPIIVTEPGGTQVGTGSADMDGKLGMSLEIAGDMAGPQAAYIVTDQVSLYPVRVLAPM